MRWREAGQRCSRRGGQHVRNRPPVSPRIRVTSQQHTRLARTTCRSSASPCRLSEPAISGAHRAPSCPHPRRHSPAAAPLPTAPAASQLPHPPHQYHTSPHPPTHPHNPALSVGGLSFPLQHNPQRPPPAHTHTRSHPQLAVQHLAVALHKHREVQRRDGVAPERLGILRQALQGSGSPRHEWLVGERKRAGRWVAGRWAWVVIYEGAATNGALAALVRSGGGGGGALGSVQAAAWRPRERNPHRR